MRLLLVRHGQTPSNVIGALDTGRPGPGLTSLGQAQARAVPVALASEAVDAVYASPLVRTQLTAAPLAAARALDVEVIEGLEEILAGVWELHTEREAVEAYVETTRRWLSGDLSAALDEGETGTRFFERYDAAIAEIAAQHTDGTAVVFSHGAAIRVWAAGRLDGIDLDDAVRWRLFNTGMCAIEGDPSSGWTLREWHQEPLGGVDLEDAVARDVPAEPIGDRGEPVATPWP